MVGSFNDKGIKTKVKWLVLVVVLATSTLLVFQLKWLESSYQTTKDQIRIDGDRILGQAFIEQRKLTADTIKMLLKNVVKSENDFTFKLDSNGNNRNYIFYNNALKGSNTYFSCLLTNEDFKLAKTDPYALFWKKVNEADYEQLGPICSRLVLSSEFDFPEGSEKDKIQAKISGYYESSKMDTRTFYRLVQHKMNKISKNIKVATVYSTNVHQVLRRDLSKVKTEQSEMIEVPIESDLSSKFGDKLDSLEARLTRLNGKGKSIYVAKPIFSVRDHYNLNKIPILMLVIDVPTTYLLGQMLTSIISSAILMLLVATSLTYMIYLIVKQKKLSDLKNDFINNMSHELKTPVATALAAVQGMQYFDVLKDEQKTKNYLNTAEIELKRLSKMISSILNSAVFESGNFNLNKKKFNLKEMLTEVSENLQQHAKKEVYLEIENNSDIEIFADQSHLYNVFANLIDNAIKYSGERVEITFSARKEDRQIYIQVKDNGNGIPLTYQKHIFDQFFRVPSLEGHRIKGHGLGLNYVKSVIEKHGGTISLKQSSPEGSTFEINLPNE